MASRRSMCACLFSLLLVACGGGDDAPAEFPPATQEAGEGLASTRPYALD